MCSAPALASRRPSGGSSLGSGLPSARLRSPGAGGAGTQLVARGGSSATRVPRRPYVLMTPRWRSVRYASATVAVLTLSRSARSRIVGSDVPGGSVPPRTPASTLEAMAALVDPVIAGRRRAVVWAIVLPQIVRVMENFTGWLGVLYECGSLSPDQVRLTCAEARRLAKAR